jgi:hypothetical protein
MGQIEPIEQTERSNPQAARVRRAPNTPGRRIALLIYLLSPLLVLALLVWLIMVAQQSGPRMNEPPKGAGAGETGMGKGFIPTR